MLYKLPVVLNSNGKLPPLDSGDADDEAHILPAFKKLVNLFWIFDQSGAFEILQDSADGAEGAGARNFDVLSTLQRRLQEDALDLEQGGNDVQKADILATRQWMQILIWRANTGRRANAAAIAVAVHGPIQIAKEFLDLAARLPSAALEAHGPGIEFKVFEIASAVADTLLASTRGGNNSLLRLLGARIAQAEAQPAALFSLGPTMVHHQRVDEILDGGISSWNHANGNPEQTFDVQAYHDQAAMTQMQPLGWPFPASPWLSLVAAAELEQQQHADGTRGQQMQGEAEGMSPGTGGWFSQSLDLLAQLESEPPTSEASMESLPGNNSVDMMTGDPWLLDLGQS
ncbi:sucrose utilization protein SUC1 like [Verticillium longisporum]|uniref:Sucrose utilization protein SUC1 like n=1 Tax=Verticillium longisporum TaxID=100787 RepID=A0A8I3AN90_VERLO|nr:sucrose utilization protein SUC1 like [Verticillium longisporum]